MSQTALSPQQFVAPVINLAQKIGAGVKSWATEGAERHPTDFAFKEGVTYRHSGQNWEPVNDQS